MSDENAESPAPCEPVTVTLRKPVTLEVKTGNGARSKTISELTIRPVRGKDLRRLKPSEPPLVQTLNMLSWLSGESMQVIDELEGDDLGRALGVVNDFLFATQGTGEKSSDTSPSDSPGSSSPG